MLKIQNLQKTFNQNTENQLKLFSNFNLHIEEGQLVTILGGNGCGKTTLFNLISRNLNCDGGSIILDNKNITKLPEEELASLISKVHQNPSMGVSPSLTILENLSLAYKKNKKFGFKKLIQKSELDNFLQKLRELNLGLENKLNAKVKYLSGGQRQALSLIMATLHHPKLLLLDEHTAALDPKTSKIIMEKTQELIWKNKITTLMISHNLRDALQYSNRIIMLKSGEIILDKSSQEVDEAEIIKIYGNTLS
ncbi:MAG: ABC transporter ATP-binding protein [Filifactoraceae bacterium]